MLPTIFFNNKKKKKNRKKHTHKFKLSQINFFSTFFIDFFFFKSTLMRMCSITKREWGSVWYDGPKERRPQLSMLFLISIT